MASRQKGFSLLESLMTVVVLSIGLLGLGHLQAGLWKSAAKLHAQAEALLLGVNDLEGSRRITPTADGKPESRLTPGGSGYTVFEQHLESETDGLLRALRSSVQWQDTDDSNTLRLQTVTYHPGAGDSRWLLSRN